mmetsp:Transcript_20866/g.40808  ORF Transcript_20866/g.40808 Transcript_20866/m.40808 type:complete len:111 (-) Transcript_20866:63-395(-)
MLRMACATSGTTGTAATRPACWDQSMPQCNKAGMARIEFCSRPQLHCPQLWFEACSTRALIAGPLRVATGEQTWSPCFVCMQRREKRQQLAADRREQKQRQQASKQCLSF